VRLEVAPFPGSFRLRGAHLDALIRTLNFPHAVPSGEPGKIPTSPKGREKWGRGRLSLHACFAKGSLGLSG